MRKKSVAINMLINCIRVGLNMVFPMITFPYVSQILGPENLGKVSFSTSVVNYFVIIASMGIPTYGVLICSRERNNQEKLKKTVCELLYINLILMGIAYMLFFVLLMLVSKFHEYMGLLLINSISILGTATGIDWLYNALEDFEYITLRSVAVKILSLVLIFVFVRSPGDYYKYAFILVFATIGSNILNFIHARPYIKWYPIRKIDCARHIRPIIVLFSASLAGTVAANTDTIMIGFFMDNYAVGIYNFAVKIKTLLSSIMTAALTAVIPRFSLYIAQKEYNLFHKQAKVLYQFTMAVAIFLSTFVIAFRIQIIQFLGGIEYMEAEYPLVILSVCVVVLANTWMFGVAILQPLGRESDYTKGIFVGCAINVLGNCLLIPFLGVSGAALATLLSELAIAIVFYIELRNFVNDFIQPVQILSLIVQGSFSIGFVHFLYSDSGFCFVDLMIEGICSTALFLMLAVAGNSKIRKFLSKYVVERTKKR